MVPTGQVEKQERAGARRDSLALVAIALLLAVLVVSVAFLH
jgi:hypothetical protein